MTREEHIYQLIQYLQGRLISMCPASSLYWQEHCEEVIKALEQEPTTKNDLGVDCIDRQAALDITWHDPSYSDPLNVLTEVRDKIRELPSVTPQLSSELEKNSKKLEKNFGELDCISREQAQTEIEMSASRYTIAKERGGMGQVEWSDQLIKVSDAVDIIRNLPSVTPQEPRWIPVSEKYEHHIDHTDCIWYGNDSGCPVTCSQYRDGWNDAMDYIFKNGNGYQPYRRDIDG